MDIRLAIAGTAILIGLLLLANACNCLVTGGIPAGSMAPDGGTGDCAPKKVSLFDRCSTRTYPHTASASSDYETSFSCLQYLYFASSVFLR